MKHKLLLLATSFMMALSGSALADTGYVTIGTETSSSSDYPYGNNYNYSTTQSIYTAAEIGAVGTIKTLAYNVAKAGSLSTTSVQIYMGHTSKSSFIWEWDEENVSNMTLVYSGSPTLATQMGWEELTLSTPFIYNGTENLVIVVGGQSDSYNGSAKYYYSFTSSTQCLFRQSYNSSSYGDPTSTGNYYISTDRANVRLGFEVKEIGQFSYIISPETTATVCGTTATGAVSIPSSVTIDGKSYAVTAILGGAFQNKTDITSIVIPNGVTSIGYRAFQGCSSLTSIEIPNSVTSIGYSAFYGCSNLTNIVIPNSVTSIGYSAFQGCSSLASINIPTNVTRIYDSTFQDCSSLTNIVIPNSVTSIGYYAFYGCSSLTNIEIPNSVTSIGYRAFQGCSSLTSIEIPNSVTSISYSVFEDCSSLISIVIPNSVTSIGSSVFEGCSSLTSIVIPNSVTSIGYRAISSAIIHLQSTTPVSISSSPFVDPGAIYYVPASAVDAYKAAWPNYADKIIAEGTQTEYDVTIAAANSLSELHRTIGEENLNKVVSLTIHGSINSYDFMILRNKMSNLLHLDLSDCRIVANDYEHYTGFHTEADKLPARAFSDMSYLRSLKLPTTITAIGEYALYDCRGLSSLEIPEGIHAYEKGTFSGSGLTTVSMPSDMTIIPERLFENCKNLTSIIIPEGVTTIDTYAFNGCYHLTELTIPASVTNVKDCAFNGCSGVQKLVLEDGPVALSVGRYDPNNSGSSNYYYTTFSQFSSLQELYLGRNVSYLGYSYMDSSWNSGGGFNWLRNLRQVEIGNQVTYLGRCLFYACTSLQSIVLPASLQNIYINAFDYCTSLKNVTVEESAIPLTIYGSSPFNDSPLEKVVQNRAINCDGVFSGRTTLKEVSIGNKVTAIGTRAYQGCTALKVLNIPSSIRTIGEEAFGGCTGLDTVYTRTMLPTQILQQTFAASTYNNATLMVPRTSYYIYYYNTQWSQFKHLKEFDGEFDNFYLGGDLEIDGTTGGVNGDPDITVEPGGGLIVNNDGEQTAGVIEIKSDGSIAGSVIAKGTLTADSLYIRVSMKANTWYFLSLPCDVELKDISAPGSYVIYTYDGAARALAGNGGWKKRKDLTKMERGIGYIIQCAKEGELITAVKRPSFLSDDYDLPLEEHKSDNPNNTSWNCVGNPYTAYYPIQQMGITSPVTIWDVANKTYYAYSTVDDAYAVSPFQSFFVQRVGGVSQLSFKAEHRLTYEGVKDYMKGFAQAAAMRGVAAPKSSREIVTLSVSNDNGADRTRVVFNDEAQMGYEMDKDADKMMSADADIQIYTLYNDEMFAINERPVENGDVQLGFTANQEGSYTIEASELPVGMLLLDKQTGITTDLSEGSYLFSTKVGTYQDRFVLTRVANETGIEQMKVAKTAEGVYYNAAGAAMGSDKEQLPAGTYVIKMGGKTSKVVIK